MAPRMTVLNGYDLDERGRLIRYVINTSAPGDYGSDPVGDGMVRMHPSGEIVTADEARKRLDARQNVVRIV